MRIGRQTVARDDGRPYVARKPPEVVEVTLNGYTPGILVLRCHDLDVANVAAFGAFLSSHSRDGNVSALDPSDPFLSFATGDPALPLWVRWVPDTYPPDPARPDAGVWERELRGTIGATPAVLFARAVDLLEIDEHGLSAAPREEPRP